MGLRFWFYLAEIKTVIWITLDDEGHGDSLECHMLSADMSGALVSLTIDMA